MNSDTIEINKIKNVELRLSTITAISKLSDSIDLSELFDKLTVDDNIKFLEYGVKYKGTIDRKNLKKREKNKKKFFYNQITIHLYLTHENITKKINVKLFNNGSIQMTGLKYIDQEKTTVKFIFDKIKSLNIDNKIYKTEDLKILNYSIAMINTDFDIGFKVNRVKLNRYLIGMGIFTSYEPCVYPGVNIKYYYKKDKPNGICNCCNICDGKELNNTCKKITIAVFNSGKVIITGGNKLNHCNKAFNFISNILIENKDMFIDK